MLAVRPFRWIALASALLSPAASYAQNSCTRESLQTVAATYIEPQTKGARVVRAEAMAARMASQTPFPLSQSPFPSILLGSGGYVENFDTVAVASRLVDQPLTMDHHRSLLDTTMCETFTEVIVTDKSEPYALGTRHRLDRGRVTEIEVMWSTTGYVGFDADLYLKATSTENWTPIPVGERDPRATLEAVANIYMDALLEGKAEVEPWGLPCKNRTAGGYCQVGLPVAAVNIANRHSVVDETIGAVAILSTFGAPPASGRIRTPDAHVFRIENGRVRFVHAITHLPPTSGPAQ